ncbi:MAG: hypothetical protein LBR98_03000 [Syntrophomonadaceae bacterium]|nr:hypothetical protein [Syntrophomonadaceae bacterium]
MGGNISNIAGRDGFSFGYRLCYWCTGVLRLRVYGIILRIAGVAAATGNKQYGEY